jgi:initiation factor 1A
MSTNRNTFGGKGYKKAKSGNVRRRSKNPDMPVDVSTGYDHYALVLKKLGNNRLSVKLDNGQEVQAVIPGRFMKKVWFNVGDHIHVKREGVDGKFYYDIFQKITNENELQNAKSAIQKKLDDGEQDIFRPDINLNEEDDEDDEENNNSDDNRDDNSDDESNTFTLDKPKSKLNNYKITSDKLKKQNISIDKLHLKQRQKERDISRRAEPEFIEKPVSVVQTVQTVQTVQNVQKDEKNISENSDDIDIDDI